MKINRGDCIRLENVGRDQFSVYKDAAMVRVLCAKRKDNNGRKGTYVVWDLVKTLSGSWNPSGSTWLAD